MALQSLSSTSFDEIIYDKEERCLVLFSRKICHICQNVVPIVEQLKSIYQDKCGFYYIDIEEQESLYQRFSIRGVPQILFFSEGEYRGRLAGQVDKRQIEDKMAEF